MRFIEKHCRVPEGDLVGQAVQLAPFQEDFFYSVYDNKVHTRTAILSMARKNAKTATIAFIVIVHLVGPEAKYNSRISSGARSRKQAAEVYNYASKCVEQSQTLRDLVRTVPSHKKIVGLLMNTEYEALAAEGATAHGGSPIVAILDELGQVKGPTDAFVDAMVTSQGAYDNPLLIVISTQAPTDADMLSIMIDDAIRAQDPSIVCHLYTADRLAADGKTEIPLTDRKQWAKANPAMGLFRSEADIADKAEKATRMPSAESAFRVLYLNQRVNMVAAFVSASVWAANRAEPEDEAFLAGPVYGGLDLSATTDLTALLLTARAGGKVSVRPYFWMPQMSVLDASKRDRAPYDVWVREGLIRTTPGMVIDYEHVARDMAGLLADLPLAAIAFDPWRMDRLKSACDRIGLVLPFVPFIQGYKSFTPALDALEADLLKGNVCHGGNPVLAMCAANAVVVKDPALNRKLDKNKSNGRIDGLVALAMAEGAEAGPVEEEVDILSLIG